MRLSPTISGLWTRGFSCVHSQRQLSLEPLHYQPTEDGVDLFRRDPRATGVFH